MPRYDLNRLNYFSHISRRFRNKNPVRRRVKKQVVIRRFNTDILYIPLTRVSLEIIGDVQLYFSAQF